MRTERTTEAAEGEPRRTGPGGAPVALRVIPPPGPRAPARRPQRAPERTTVALRAPRRRVTRQRAAVPALLLAVDAGAAVAVAAVLAAAARPPGAFSLTPPAAQLPLPAALLALLLALNAAAGLYRPAPMAAALDELPRLAAHAAMACCLAAVLLPEPVPWPRTWPWLLAASAGQATLACAARAAVHHARRQAARRRPRPALVVGTGPAGQRVAAALASHLEYGMRPVGLVGPVPPRLPEIAPLPVLTTPRDVTRAVIQNGVRDAVFACPPQEALVRLFRERGCAVWLVDAEAGGAGAERTHARLPARAAGHLWGFPCARLEPGGGPPFAQRWGRLAKRALDVGVAALALLLAAPLLAACALAVRTADGPGVIFRQERVGQDGRRFTMLKFRTLCPAGPHESATRWTVAHDRRMSAVGRALRRTSLDELPQLWNVLRGDMSLVGPRPERPHFVERFSRAYPGYADRHRVPVGLTGLAQISGLRGDTSIEDRTRFDNHYIDTWSLWQDVRIMLRTTAVCFRPRGS